MVDMQWWLSGYDNRVHAFRAEQASSKYGEALCEHSVPTAKITLTDDGPRCVACLLIFGDMLADTYGDVTWRAS